VLFPYQNDHFGISRPIVSDFNQYMEWCPILSSSKKSEMQNNFKDGVRKHT
jgi:hypothetical protein